MTSENIEFNEEAHSYHEGDKKLDSVTTWIKSHFPDFDAERISKYSARSVRNEIRGWSGDKDELVVQSFPKSVKLFGEENWEAEVTNRSDKKIPINSREVRKFWEDKGTRAADEGTRIHELIELAIKGEIGLIDLLDDRVVISALNFKERLFNQHKVVQALPELRMYVSDLGLAGTIDLFIETDEGVILVDWKTNDKLSWDGYNKGLTDATSSIKDSKLQLYTLQLSLYAYILEEGTDVRFEYGGEEVYLPNGLNVLGMWLYHLVPGDCQPIEIEYQKELIKEMLEEDGRL